MESFFNSWPQKSNLCELVHINGDTALQVGCFVLVDDVDLCELVNHSEHLRHGSLGCCFVGGIADRLDGVAGCTCILFVMHSAFLALAITLVC